jgi:AAA domain, putative AbiEii toxin, Type IV TA system
VKIRRIETKTKVIAFGDVGRLGRNKLDVLTGPNGSGKTEALTVLVDAYARFRHGAEDDEDGAQVSAFGRLFSEATAPPSRVLAQTFSPFTRFPEPPRAAARLLDVYELGTERHERYICVGLHKSFRGMAGHLSRKILEEALFRVSEFPPATEALFSVMKRLDFLPGLRLVYRPRPGTQKLFSDPNQGEVYEFLSSSMQARVGFKSHLSESINEALSSRSLADVASAITDALLEARSLMGKVKPRSLLSFDVDLSSIRREFYLLQAFSLLRRLGLLSLTQCELTRAKGKAAFDVANASSGEQQMLCSIFGLASAIRDEALVLIDEPELSLHPKRQIEFIDAIESLLKMVSGCHVILSTHSPVVVQAAQALGAGITQLGDTHPHSSMKEPSKQFSVEQALLEVFDTPVPGSAHVSNQIFKAIVSAETGNAEERNLARQELEGLERLYEGAKVSDPTPALIKDALRLVNEVGSEDDDGREIEG